MYNFFLKAVGIYWVLFAKHCGYTEIEKNKILKSVPQSQFITQIKKFLRCFQIPSALLENTNSTLTKVCQRIQIPEIQEPLFQGTVRFIIAIIATEVF